MEQAPSHRWTRWLEIGVFVPVALFYLLSLSMTAALGGSDSLGNSLSSSFAILSELVLWIGLGAFVTLTCRGAGLSVAMIAIGATLGLFGAYACLVAVGLLPEQEAARITLILVPPLVAAFGIWARLSADHPQRYRRLAVAGFALLGAGALAPALVEQQKWEAAAPERQAEQERLEAEYRRGEAEAAARIEGEFRALGPDSRLEQFFPHLGGDHDAEAIAKIRSARSRQADAVRLLDGGIELYEMFRMSEFGLEVEPELCRAFRAAVDRRIAGFDANDPNTFVLPIEAGGHLETFRWLHGGGCDMSSQARRVAAQLRAHPNADVQSDAVPFEAMATAPHTSSW